ncbi:VOC family protein [Paenibacillus sp. 19GGS1-52]|uniref:VOC family protein n=1 Tax=Paenibacillus sp. 19GGS1-52 TaxID=2758563 RepID=UPI001EFB99E2|nr:VOC family protein [Paenibacillus sp. 19GGS1-52]ULO07626.1 VOC family protein [Paenibacillus sp. 19GGS1-52]
MTNTSTLRGMANVSFWAEDLKAAKEWYTKLLGVEPYFQSPNPENPVYLEYRIGDFQDELGIIDKKYAPNAASLTGTGGVTLYWHVDDVVGMLKKLKELGATEYEPLTERGIDWITASVVDPFGNIIGLIHSPHYKEMWNSTYKA